MKKILTLMMTTCLSAGLMAQNGAQDEKSKEILGELSKKAKSYKTIQAGYTLTYKKGKSTVSNTSGKIWVKGKQFKFTSSDGQDIMSDGTTVWNYVKDDQIVYVGPVSEIMEDQDISDPSELFTIWENDFKSRFVKEETVNGKVYQVIYLSPMKPAEKKFHTIVLKIDKAAQQVHKFIIKSNDGSTSIYKVNSFKTNVEIGDGTFKWTPKPGVEEEEM